MEGYYKRSLIILAILAGSFQPLYPQATSQTPFYQKAVVGVTGVLTGAWTAHRVWQAHSRATRIKDAQHSIAHYLKEFPEPDNSTGEEITLFSPGIESDRTTGKKFKDLGFIPTQLHTFDFDNSKLLPESQRKPSSIGQEADMYRLAKEYFELVDQGYRVTIYGTSRGAATAILFLALFQPKNVVRVILQSPFRDVEDVVSALLGYMHLGWVPGLSVIGNLLCSHLEHTNYSTGGIRPIDVIAKIPTTIPVLFVCSLEDTFVPPLGTAVLHETLKAAGHPHCYIAILKRGFHTNIASHKKRDADFFARMAKAQKKNNEALLHNLRSQYQEIINSRAAYQEAVLQFFKNPLIKPPYTC